MINPYVKLRDEILDFISETKDVTPFTSEGLYYLVHELSKIGVGDLRTYQLKMIALYIRTTLE